MDIIQKTRQERGQDFERDIALSLKSQNVWFDKLETAYDGTPFDFIVVDHCRTPIAIECKVIENGMTLPYSRLKDRQRTFKVAFGLERFLKFGKSYILCNKRNDEVNELYIIPWEEVNKEFWEAYNYSENGSFKLSKFPFLTPIDLIRKGKKTTYKWDLSSIMKGELITIENYFRQSDPFI